MVKWRYGGMCVCFILLVGCTSVDVFFEELGHPWPPVSDSYEWFSFEIARMSHCLMVVEFLNKV